jgi:hypothetical protein
MNSTASFRSRGNSCGSSRGNEDSEQQDSDARSGAPGRQLGEDQTEQSRRFDRPSRCGGGLALLQVCHEGSDASPRGRILTEAIWTKWEASRIVPDLACHAVAEIAELREHRFKALASLEAGGVDARGHRRKESKPVAKGWS